MKIHAEEMNKKGFDDIPIDEIVEMVGYVEPIDNGKAWEVTTSDGGSFVCKKQEEAYIMAGIEEIKAKLFAL